MILMNDLKEQDKSIGLLTSESWAQSLSDDDFLEQASSFIMSQRLQEREYIYFQGLAECTEPSVLRSFFLSIVDSVRMRNGHVETLTFKNGISHKFTYLAISKGPEPLSCGSGPFAVFDSNVPADHVIGVPVAPPLEQAIPACELLSCAVIGAVAGFQIAVIIEPLSGVLFVCRVQLVRQSDKFKASIVVCAYNARVGDLGGCCIPGFPASCW